MSQPFGNWTTEDLEYLSAEQALSDIATFIRLYFNVNDPPRKWVVIGGSYPGGMSAWFRARYPEWAVASWASSAPVQAISDFWEYDQ